MDEAMMIITIKYTFARRLHKIISTTLRCDGWKRPNKVHILRVSINRWKFVVAVVAQNNRFMTVVTPGNFWSIP